MTKEQRLARIAVKCPCCAGRGKVRLETRSPAASRNELVTAIKGASNGK